MTPASASVVFSGVSGGNADNSGSAAILDQNPDFLPYAQRMMEVRRQEKIRKFAQDKQNEKDWAALQKSFDPSGVQLRDQKQLADKLKAYNDELVKLKVGGADPLDYYSPAGQRAQEIRAEALNLKKASIDNLKFRQDVAKQIAEDPTLDKKAAIDWMKTYDSLPTIEEQLKFREESSPFRKAFSYESVTDRVVPVAFEIATEKGNKTIKKGGLDRAKMRAGVLKDLETQEGMADFEAWMTQHPESNEDDYVEDVVEKASTMIKDTFSQTYDEPRPQSASAQTAAKKEEEKKLAYDYDNALSTGKWGSGWDIRYDPPNKDGIETVTVRKGQTDWSPIKVVGMDGQTIDKFRHQKFFTRDGKLYAHGLKEDEDGEMVEVTVPFDENAGEFTTIMDSFDPRILLEKARPSQGGVKKPKPY